MFSSTLRIGPYLFYIEKFTTQFKTTEKMIGHCSRFRENDDLPVRRGPVEKKKPPFSNARTLITHEIMRSRDAQCNTEEWPQVTAVFYLLYFFAQERDATVT